MLHVDASVCRLVAVSGISQAAYANALSQRIPLSNQACVSSLARWTSLRLSRQDGTTAKQLMTNACVLRNGQAFVTFHTFIESNGVLFLTLKLPNPAKNKHFIGYASGKIDMRGDILET